jgi:putative hydrolase of the HAD superfamily
MSRLCVFDLGGVVVDICHEWEEAAALAAVPIRNSSPGRLADFSGTDAYNAAELSLDEYLEALADWLGCDGPAQALKVHNAILKAEIKGALELILELKGEGWMTACLSNTNEAHWSHLIQSGRFPSMAALDRLYASHILGLNKPDPAIYSAVQADTGAEPGEIVFFDDVSINVDAALAKGWRALRIDPAGGQADQMRAFLSA